MAGFGGFGSAFPTRQGMAAPQSRGIDSTQEFNMGWERTMPEKYIAAPGGTELVNGWGGFDAAAADPFRSGINNQFDADFASGVSAGASADQLAGLKAAQEFARSAGVVMSGGQQDNGGAYGVYVNPYTDKGGQYTALMGGSHSVYPAGSSSTMINPEWEAKKSQWDAASAQRAENQTRQQQAYDTVLMGNNAIGGVMPSNYTDANFGQITGQQGGGPADMTGIDMTQQTGAYMPGTGAYNPDPFAATNYRPGYSWGGF